VKGKRENIGGNHGSLRPVGVINSVFVMGVVARGEGATQSL